jgi:hypothetical protein
VVAVEAVLAVDASFEEEPQLISANVAHPHAIAVMSRFVVPFRVAVM